jgi:hypothetical protein
MWTMMVSGKSESGQWVMWRVGRRRLAWRPRSVARFLDGADGPFIVLAIIPLTGYLLNWVGALLATVVVWPSRAISGDWPVVAYLLDPQDGDQKLQRAQVSGRVDADAMARRWVLDIKQRGQPQIEQ